MSRFVGIDDYFEKIPYNDYLFARLIIVSFWTCRLFYKAISTINFRTHLSDESEVECGFIFQAKTPVLRLT